MASVNQNISTLIPTVTSSINGASHTVDVEPETPLASYLIRRFLLMLPTLFGISVLIFVLLRMVPGNIADILFAAAGMIDPAEKASLERDLGLD